MTNLDKILLIAIGILCLTYIILTAINAINTLKIKTFRKGITWGMTLFARHAKDKKGKSIQVIGRQGLPLTELVKEVNDGQWDDVLKRL